MIDSYTCMNSWFYQLSKEGRQLVLIYDKWELAEAAFNAGLALGKQASQPVSESHNKEQVE